eukprot:2475154-Karenia_brevis.AAC.1
MVDLYREYKERNMPLTPELMKIFTMLRSRRRRLDGRWDNSVVILTLDKICGKCGTRDVAHSCVSCHDVRCLGKCLKPETMCQCGTY